VNLRTILLVLLLPLTFAAQGQTREAVVNVRPGPLATPQLVEAIAQKDRELFDAVFETCDLAKLKTLLTDDFEFYHDKGGFTPGAKFLDNIKGTCERQEQGIDFKGRRVLDVASVTVYPLANYGAIQVGVHKFYAVKKGKPDQPTEIAKFTHVWKNVDGQWKLARSLSYDHRPLE
jgi:Domain of unknown function (DUF4440)